MPAFSHELFLSTLGLIGVVIVASALFSGAIDKLGIPQVAVFLAIGALIGPSGLHIMDAGVESPILRIVATLSLALVLFTDAVSIDIGEIRRHKLMAFLVLGPGTFLTAAIIALLSWRLLGLHPALAAILGAALSSTDPVLLRSFLRRPGLDPIVRQALRVESGMNDAVLLPIVLIAIEMMKGGGQQPQWAKLAVEMLILSPGIGAVVAGIAVGMLDFVRRRAGVRRDYESIYSIGVCFAAFAGAEAVHGSGFIAAFAAGLTVAAIDVDLCDCFLEYGETTAEMALLFAFVLFGSSVLWTGFDVLSPVTVAFAALVFLARIVAFVPALLPVCGSWKTRLLIAWFGPRGLSSLLLVLLAVFANVPGAANLLAICSLVVIFSVVVHGFSPMLLSRRPAEEIPQVESDKPTNPPEEPEYITIEEYRKAVDAGEPITLVDSRTERSFNDSKERPGGGIRIHPEHAVADARAVKLPRQNVLAVLCA